MSWKNIAEEMPGRSERSCYEHHKRLLERIQNDPKTDSVQVYANRTREQPSSHEILDKLNQIHHLTKSSIAEDITLIKNAVNHAATQPSTRTRT
jgi:hypothetical protein